MSIKERNKRILKLFQEQFPLSFEVIKDFEKTICQKSRVATFDKKICFYTTYLMDIRFEFSFYLKIDTMIDKITINSFNLDSVFYSEDYDFSNVLKSRLIG